jgi:glycosyltransferase involved in cell wall biosynthesis
MARILVALHQLELGGSQLNGLDLAVAMRDRGHEVTVFAPSRGRPGPVAELVAEAGLPLELVDAGQRPARLAPLRRSVARRLTEVVSAGRIELVHSYEYPLSLDSFYGPHLRLGTPVVYTIYGMVVPRWLPRDPAMVVGTRELAERAAGFRGRPAVLIEPPVNTDADDPEVVDAAAFRAEHGLAADDTVLVVVSRLEPDMKADSIERAMGAVRMLAAERSAGGRLRLLVVGDGPSRDQLAAGARAVNAALGYPAVILTGLLHDPRPAYAAADVALGMGGSALRAMAFGKPLVVLGIRGFARPFTPATADVFFRQGFYGVGSDAGGHNGTSALAAHLRQLLDAGPEERRRLGALSRRVVLDRYSLGAAAERLEAVYCEALGTRPTRRRRAREATRTFTYRSGSELVPERAKARVRPLLRRHAAPAPRRS